MYHNGGGLYRPEFEKDNCGFGLIAQMDGKPSHKLINNAINALARLTHRGAVAADGKTGDGCGILMAMPDSFMRGIAANLDIKLSKLYGTALVFFSQDKAKRKAALDHFNEALQGNDLSIAGWRDLELDEEALGEQARRSVPCIKQVFVNGSHQLNEHDFERKLFLARRVTEKAISPDDEEFYIPSLSCRLFFIKAL